MQEKKKPTEVGFVNYRNLSFAPDRGENQREQRASRKSSPADSRIRIR